MWQKLLAQGANNFAELRFYINGVLHEIADREMFTLAANRGHLHILPERLSEGEFTGINEESVCDEKYKNVSEKVRKKHWQKINKNLKNPRDSS